MPETFSLVYFLYGKKKLNELKCSINAAQGLNLSRKNEKDVFVFKFLGWFNIGGAFLLLHFHCVTEYSSWYYSGE